MSTGSWPSPPSAKFLYYTVPRSFIISFAILLILTPILRCRKIYIPVKGGGGPRPKQNSSGTPIERPGLLPLDSQRIKRAGRSNTRARQDIISQ